MLVIVPKTIIYRQTLSNIISWEFWEQIISSWVLFDMIIEHIFLLYFHAILDSNLAGTNYLITLMTWIKLLPEILLLVPCKRYILTKVIIVK